MDFKTVLLEYVEKRDKLFDDYCKGSSWAEMCHNPEASIWYADNIVPLNKRIVLYANMVMSQYNLPGGVQRTIKDVYNNMPLIDLLNKTKKERENTK